MELLNTGIIDFILLILGFAVGIFSKFRVPITIAIIMFKAFQWFLKTHPHGQMIAAGTNADERLDKMYDDKLCNQDVLAVNCGGSGNVPQNNEIG